MDGENQFSGVPALSDTQGLQDYLNNESLKQSGISEQNIAPIVQQETNNGTGDANANVNVNVENAQTAQNQNASNVDVQSILAELQAVKAELESMKQAAGRQTQNVGNNVSSNKAPAYSQDEINFINAALARGYDMNAIQQTIMQKRNAMSTNNSDVNRRVDSLEQYIKQKEYETAQNAFIERMTEFGNKWGLSEADLVTFGNVALSKGINIANVNDLEIAFRAVYPEQYAIRKARMTPTNTSQIYGGTSIPESTRAAADKAADAYVDAYLRQTMPSYGKK